MHLWFLCSSFFGVPPVMFTPADTLFPLQKLQLLTSSKNALAYLHTHSSFTALADGGTSLWFAGPGRFRGLAFIVSSHLPDGHQTEAAADR